MSGRRRGPLVTLLAAAFLFRIGNGVASLALPWFVLSQTGSAARAGVTAAAGVVASIVGAWVGGGLVDRCGRAPVALFSGVAGGAATGAIPLLDSLDARSTAALLVLVVLGAAFDAPGMAAQDSVLPDLGRRAGLSVERVSSLKAAMGNAAVLGGPVLGGAAIGWLGAARTLWITAACSVAAGLLAARVLAGGAGRSATADFSLRAGTTFLWREPVLRPLLGVVMLFAGVVGANGSVVVPALFVEAGRPATEQGLFTSALGAGALAGIALHAAAGARIPPRIWLGSAFATFAAASMVLSLLPGVPLLVALGAAAGLMTGPVSPILNTAIYHRTPPQMLGRVLGAISGVMLAAAPAVTLAAGLLVEHAGPGAGLLASAAVAGGLALLSPRLRFDAPARGAQIPIAAQAAPAESGCRCRAPS